MNIIGTQMPAVPEVWHMTSNTATDAVRSAHPVPIRWRRYLADLAAAQPPPPPAILRFTSNTRATEGRVFGGSEGRAQGTT